jgi:hypothetical protein
MDCDLKMGFAGVLTEGNKWRRVLLAVMFVVSLTHLVTLDRVPWVDVMEPWFVGSAYNFHQNGSFADPMFPGLVAFEHGSFGQGKLRLLLQASSFDVLGFGLFQSRLPMLLGGFLAVFACYKLAAYLWGRSLGLCSAALFLLAPIFFEAHTSGSHSWLAACFTLAAYFTGRLLQEGRARFAGYAGLAVGLSVSFHMTGILAVVPLSVILLWYLVRGRIERVDFALYLAGGGISFALWFCLDVVPVGIDAYLAGVFDRSDVVKAGYLGSRWVSYFIAGRRGAFLELAPFVLVLTSYPLYREDKVQRFTFVYILGLLSGYAVLSGSGSTITVWPLMLALLAGIIPRMLGHRGTQTPLWRVLSVCGLLLFLAYSSAVQCKRVYTAFYVEPVKEYYDLCERITACIPPGATVMAGPLYWFGLAGRNHYLTSNFYWERMNSQTHELGLVKEQPSGESAQKMFSFIKRREVSYIIADERFRQAISPWIAEPLWSSFFEVKARFLSDTYGARPDGGKPPFSIQVWKLRRIAQL